MTEHFKIKESQIILKILKNLPAMRETWVWSVGWEDPLEEGMTTHSSVLAWRIPWTEEPGGLQSMGSQRLRYDWAKKHTYTHHIRVDHWSTGRIWPGIYTGQCGKGWCHRINNKETLRRMVRMLTWSLGHISMMKGCTNKGYRLELVISSPLHAPL